MNILAVGGTGTMGQAVVAELKQRHAILTAGHENGDIQVDITSPGSIEKMYVTAKQKLGGIDALICTAGKVHFGDLTAMTDKDFELGLRNKLMGQVNLVMIGMRYIKNDGSFTLISGILNHDPIRYGVSAAMVNGALEGFVKSAAFEMPHKIRINLVSPTVLTESMPHYENYFRGFEPVSAAKAALAFSKSVEGVQTGQIYRVGY